MNPQIATQIKQQTGLIWTMRNNAQYARSYFAYHVDFASIAPGASLTQNVVIQSDSHFLVHALTFTCFDLTTHGQITAPDSTIQITDTGSGTNLYDGAVELLNVVGTAQLPAILVPPRLFAPAANISVQITNVVSTNAQKYEIVFLGEKIFDYSGG